MGGTTWLGSWNSLAYSISPGQLRTLSAISSACFCLILCARCRWLWLWLGNTSCLHSVQIAMEYSARCSKCWKSKSISAIALISVDGHRLPDHITDYRTRNSCPLEVAGAGWRLCKYCLYCLPTTNLSILRLCSANALLAQILFCCICCLCYSRVTVYPRFSAPRYPTKLLNPNPTHTLKFYPTQGT
jgi:hypothetical protein